jgi:hypothetical protein
MRCAAGACSEIPGATGASYTPVLADEGKQLRLDVTATAPGGEADGASSALTPAVVSGPPQNTGPPGVFGEAREGETLSAANGAWSASPTSFLYQWLRCATAAGTSCVEVPGATTSTYPLTRGDVGATMRLRVRAVNAVGTSAPADSAQTAEVLRIVIRARLSISPNPSCTGSLTTFDGSKSTTPNGSITDYTYRYKLMPKPLYMAIIWAAAFGGGSVKEIADKYLAGVPSKILKRGANTATIKPPLPWTRRLTETESLSGGKIGDYARDAMAVTLTVTDSVGAKASATGYLDFAQAYSSEPRSKCPSTPKFPDYAFGVVAEKASFTPALVAIRVPCAVSMECVGDVAVVVAGRRAGRSAAKKPVVLAGNPFFSVSAKSRATVRAKLTKAGRKLVKRGKPIRAIVRLTSVNAATGKRTTRSTPVTWPGKKKKKKPGS